MDCWQGRKVTGTSLKLLEKKTKKQKNPKNLTLFSKTKDVSVRNSKVAFYICPKNYVQTCLQQNCLQYQKLQPTEKVTKSRKGKCGKAVCDILLVEMNEKCRV